MKALFPLFTSICLLVSISACGPGTFLGTWSDILADGESESQSSPGNRTGDRSPPKEASNIKQIKKLNSIQIFGVENRQRGILWTSDDAETGFSVTSGDINGDRVDDIIIGAPDSEGILPDTTRSGWVYVILGRSNLLRKVDLAKYADISFWGGEEAGRNLLGHSLVSSDLNGDGISDLVIGAPYGSGRGDNRIHSGMVYVFFGRESLKGIVDLSRQADVTILGAQEGDLAGFSLATGDLNGDKLSDLIIGAPGGDGYLDKASEAGETYIIYGRKKFPRVVDLSKDWNSRVFGIDSRSSIALLAEDSPDKSGYAVASCDLNGDGLDDLIIGAPFGDGFLNKQEDAGETYVVFGRKKFPKDIHLSSQADITLYGTKRWDHSGAALMKGDLNGDGVDDLILSSPTAERKMKSGPSTGLLYAVYGKRNHPKEYHLRTDASIIFKNNAVGQCDFQGLATVGAGSLPFGRSITVLDLNSDGRDDLVVGVPCAQGRGGKTHSGEISFFYSREHQRMVNPIAVFQPATTKLDELFGFSLSRGDVNGDGSADIIVGAPGMPRTKGLHSSGGAYVLLGPSKHQDSQAKREPQNRTGRKSLP